MIECVEYVVRKAPTGQKWSVYMILLDAAHNPPRMVTSNFVSSHLKMETADIKAANLRAKDDAHIARIAGTRRYTIDPR